MPTEEELANALKKADQAGNTEDAKKLANALKQIRSKSSFATPKTSPLESTAPKKEASLIQDAGTVAGLTARSVLQAPASLLEGVVNAAYGAINTAFDAVGAKPPMSENRALSNLIDKLGLPEYPETTSGRIGSMMAEGAVGAGGVIGLGTKMAGSGSALISGIGQSLSSAPVAQLASEAPSAVASELAMEFVKESGGGPFAQMVAGLAGAIGGGAITPTGAKKTLPAKPSRVRGIEQAEEALGIPGATTSAQKIGTPEEIARQTLMSRSKELIDFANESNSKTSRALGEFLDSLAGTGGSVSSGVAAREGAKTFKKSLRNAQKEATEPLYARARSENANIDTNALLSDAAAIKSEYRPTKDPTTGREITPPVYDLVSEFESRVRAAKGNLGDLQNVKFWLDGRLERRGDSALEKIERRAVARLKKDLVDTMSEASDAYRNANAVFEDYQKYINAADDSLIGILSDADNVQLTSTLDRIFREDVSEIKKLRRALDTSAPRAYEAIYKANLKKKLSDISDELLGAGETNLLPQNSPGAVYQRVLGGSKGMSKLIETAPTPQAKETLKYLNRVFAAASEGRGNRSLSKEIRAAEESLTGPVQKVLRKIGGLALVFGSKGVMARDAIQPAALIPDVGVTKRQQRMIESIFEKQYADDWNRIINTEPGTVRSVIALDSLLTKLGMTEEEQNQQVPNE